MEAKLVYKTEDKYIDLFDYRLEYIDYSCTNFIESEEKLRDVFSVEIDDQEGEFKILVNPLDLKMKEVAYHKDMHNFNELTEINVRYDCCDINEFMKKIADMMLNSDLVVRGLFRRFSDDLDYEEKKQYLIGRVSDNESACIDSLGSFLDKRFNETDGYLFARELEEYCRNIYNKELEFKSYTKTRG